MADAPLVSAQVVLRHADGRSLLDATGPITAESPARTAAALPPDRIAEIAERLKAAGFDVGAGTGATLSVTAPPATFRQVFGMDTAPGAAAHVPRELAPFVADVLIAPPPTLFP
jgi:hypothetical protein